jgi:hypothetical protein
MFGLRQAAVIGAIGFLAGAAWMETHNAPADKVVIIDGWWSKDYPKSSCGSITAPTNSFSTADERAGCANLDVVNPAVPFLQAVASSMALDPNCLGVTVAYVWSPASTSKDTFALEGKPHKMLIVDYVPGYDQDHRLHWGLDGATGQGTAKEIASAVCFTMSGNGARITGY